MNANETIQTPQKPPAAPKSKWSRWSRRILIVLFTGTVLFYLGDLVHSVVVNRNVNVWETTVQRDHDGVRIGCSAFSVGPESSDTALILVHGINESPYAFRKVAPRLAKNGYFCRCIRLPGFGESVAEYGKATLDEWAACIDSEIRQLKKKHQRVFLVAHSLGAAVVIQYLLQDESRQAVQGLVLATPAIQVSNARSPLLPVSFWHLTLRRTLLFTRVLQSPFGLDALDPSEKSCPMRTPFTPLHIVDLTMQLIRMNSERAGELNLPVLMCLAKHDQVIDNEAAARFFGQLPHTGNRLIEFENSAHAILVDYQWERLCKEIEEFVRQTSLGSRTKAALPEK